jgi:hypothetical protein
MVRVALWAVTCTLLFAALALVAADYKESFAVTVPCEQHNKDGDSKSAEKQCTAYRSVYFAGDRPIAVSVGTFLDDHNGAVSAVATIFIATFTIVLVIVTNRQARLALRSVKVAESALTDLERAYIYWGGIESNIAWFLHTRDSWNDDNMGPSFTLLAVNHGRTPGNIESGLIRFEVRNTEPLREPSKADQVSFMQGNEPASAEIIIGATKTYRFLPMQCDPRFRHSDIPAILMGTASLYCYGFFTYLDIFMKSHTTEFCRMYDPRRNEWNPVGGKQKNYAN